MIQHMPHFCEINSSCKSLAQKPCILQMTTLRNTLFQKVFYNPSRCSPLTRVSRAVKFWSGMLAVAACEGMFCVRDHWCVSEQEVSLQQSEIISPGRKLFSSAASLGRKSLLPPTHAGSPKSWALEHSEHFYTSKKQLSTGMK